MSRQILCLQAEHVPACQRLHKFAKYNGESVFGLQVQKDLAALLNSAAEGRDGAHGWVAVSSDSDGEGEVVGALTAQWEEPATCVLLTLVVRSDARGQGVGKALLQALQQHVRTRKAEQLGGGGGARVNSSEAAADGGGAGIGGGGAGGIKLLTDVSVVNDAALAFFKRSGFKQAGRGNGRSVELAITCCSYSRHSGGSSTRGGSGCSRAGSSSGPARGCGPVHQARVRRVGFCVAPAQGRQLTPTGGGALRIALQRTRLAHPGSSGRAAAEAPARSGAMWSAAGAGMRVRWSTVAPSAALAMRQTTYNPGRMVLGM
ncbi:hypothetical protein HYH02_008538 [Chlamydomonas schloesseri]|uniref:N-acetyltransferase domain-containing protein n=1 Tax=Chlamydomonas schloesseri TaxID=2026947 RepID=A0A835WG41_9CHLO|nr:hypothetical protein HYH02_008538 [Chlamydomonas schloesseri]|eukprot:KAG2446551.1 hypothetical protein HYH02_008538 [Chlamydomonas schloesseri]